MYYIYNNMQNAQETLDSLLPQIQKLFETGTVNSHNVVDIMRRAFPYVMINVLLDRKQTENGEVITGRFIMSRNKKSKMTIEKSIFNGIVVDLKTMKIICVPPRSLIYNIPKWIKSKMNDFTVYKATYGTVVNVYKQGQEGLRPSDPPTQQELLCDTNEQKVREDRKDAVLAITLSSANGINMNNACMFGDIPLIDIFRQLMKQYKITEDMFLDNKSYSFVFAHPDWHPNIVNPYLIYLQSTDLNTGLTELGKQPPSELPRELPVQEKVTLPLNRLLENAKKYNNDGRFAGYVFRANRRDVYNDYLLEGFNMSILRRSIYRPMRTIRNFKVLALRQYLQTTQRNLLERVCWRFAEEFKQFDKTMNELNDRISYRIGKNWPTLSKLDMVADYFIKLIENNINSLNANFKFIVRDVVMNIDHIEVLQKLIGQGLRPSDPPLL